MTRAGRSHAPVTALRSAVAISAAALSAAAGLAACGAAGTTQPKSNGGAAAQRVVPTRIIQAPGSLIGATTPRSGGIMWTLTGGHAAGLFAIRQTTGKTVSSTSVSAAARSVAETSGGVLGVALGSGKSGALQLMNGTTGKVTATVPLPAPAIQVDAAGSRFYVLTERDGTASVSIVKARRGKLGGSVPVPGDTVAVAPNPAGQDSLYALESSGEVTEIGLTSKKVSERFITGPEARWITLSPDGSTLYVLKGDPAEPNVAVVDTSTEAVTKVLPAARGCRGLLISASGNQLYEVVGTAGYGNIQVFAL